MIIDIWNTIMWDSRSRSYDTQTTCVNCRDILSHVLGARGGGEGAQRALNFFLMGVCWAGFQKLSLWSEFSLKMRGLGNENLYLESWNFGPKIGLKMQSLKKWKWGGGRGHTNSEFMERIRPGSTGWHEKRGSWPRHIPVPLSNVSAPPRRGGGARARVFPKFDPPGWKIKGKQHTVPSS